MNFTSELEKAIQNKKDQLQGKLSELQNSHDTDYSLILKLLTKQVEVGEAQSEVCSGQTDSEDLLTGINKKLAAREEQIRSLEAQIKGLQEQLEARSEEISGLSDQFKAVQKELTEKNGQLEEAAKGRTEQDLKAQETVEENAKLKNRIAALEKDKAQMENSCASLQDQYTDLKEKFEKDIAEIEGVPKLVLKINMLNTEIASLQGAVARESGDKTELKNMLAEKQKQLEDAEKDLGDKSPSSTSIKQLIAIIKERATINSDTNSDYLRQISELERELDEKIEALNGKDAEKMKAMIRVVELQDEISLLKRRLSKITQESTQELAAKEAELEKKRHMINELIAKDCGSNERQDEIAALQSEAKTLQTEIKSLRELSQKDIAELEKRLKKKEDDLKTSNEKLESLDKENGALVSKAIELQDRMKNLQIAETTLKQRTADEMADLKKQLQEMERQNVDLKAKNEELADAAKEAGACTALKDANEALKGDKAKLQDLLTSKENENKNLLNKIDDLEKQAAQKKDNEIHIVQPAIDPDTAHEKLQLSKDFREMTLLSNPLNVPEVSARYDIALAALAKTGFDSGRQYWEVSVVGKQCYNLGVAAETAQRKGPIRYNPRFLYWTIRLTRGDELIAIGKSQTKLRGQGTDKPTTIGVLLDFKKKEISFYDVGRRAHMYTFKDVESKSKLFPFMSTCEDTGVGSTPMVFSSDPYADWITS
ncbi:paramyosin-like [Engraulis encrasicolus]|uniref:paramyosin-like n=1 Tax=Engraulis encrasicolus TaxID=184585 RepID=UPI002FD319C6